MVAGTAEKEFEFIDPETGRSVKVTLTIRDGIFLKMLEQIKNSINNIK